MWLPGDTEAALAWQEAQDEMCQCGHPRSETMDPNGPDYHATALRCRACETRDALMSRWRRDEHADLAGVVFGVTERGDHG